jgi:hypothetical protein
VVEIKYTIGNKVVDITEIIDLEKKPSWLAQKRLELKAYRQKYYKEHADKHRIDVCKNARVWRAKNIVKARFNSTKTTCKRKNREFNISLEFYEELSKKPCHYCGREGPNGADRIDNSKGYTIDNVLPCCITCNRIRMDNLTVEEMKVGMSAILEYRNKNTNLTIANNS